MTNLVFSRRGSERHRSDVIRIQKACLDKEYTISYQDAVLVWEAYSEDYCAGWMTLPDSDGDIVETVLRYCDKEVYPVEKQDEI